mmetsp:Transcript_19916/g.55080  ORF Transcript_19916/g.55080 Transcript_19916/m.55080 type:complete len:85 (-) Transcript_19916:551-805(-)
MARRMLGECILRELGLDKSACAEAPRRCEPVSATGAQRRTSADLPRTCACEGVVAGAGVVSLIAEEQLPAVDMDGCSLMQLGDV